MERTARPFGFPPVTERTRVLLLFGAAILLLLLYGLFVLSFQRQRQAERRLETELFRYQSFVATAAPTAQGVDELQSQLAAAQVRAATARARLPVADQQVDVVQRVLQTARRHSVDVTQFAVRAETVSDGISEQQYDLEATGDLPNVMAFAEALETEVLPASRLQNASIVRRRVATEEETDGESEDAVRSVYVLRADLAVLSMQEALPDDRVTPEGTARAERLLAQYEEAMEEQDYERALSLLTRLSLVTSADQDDLLYDTYVAYGEYLLERGFYAQAEAQFTDALAIRPEGEEAILGLLRVSEQRETTATPEGTAPAGAPDRTPSPTPTEQEEEGQPTATFPPTQPPPPTNTRGPTNTPRPVQTRPPAATPTVTNTPGPTNTPNPYQFGAEQPVFQPNCGVTMVKGLVKTETGQPLNGVTVRVWWDGAGPQQAYSLPSGTDPTKPNGYWDVILAEGPKAGKWYVNVVDRETGRQLSEVVTVNTDFGPCQPGGEGKQVVIVDFVRFSGSLGTPAPTSTSTREPTGTTTPTNTATTTATPTVTPTPTATPVAYQCTDCPQPIPDDITSSLRSEIDVDADLLIRQLKVFVWVTHDDTNDVRVELLAPDGDRFTLKQDSDDSSDNTEVRTRYTLTDDRIVDESSQGTWTLIVTDTKPGKSGELVDWNLEIFP